MTPLALTLYLLRTLARVLPLSLVCGMGAFLLSPRLFPPRTTYAASLKIHVYRHPRNPDPNPLLSLALMRGGLRGVLGDPKFLAAVRSNPGLGEVGFLDGAPDPLPRDWVSSRVSLEFDPDDPELCYLVVRGPDPRRAARTAERLGVPFAFPAAEFIRREVDGFDPPDGVRRGKVGPTRIEVGSVWSVYVEAVEDFFPQRLRLAMSAWLLSLSVIIAGGACHAALGRRRRGAADESDESAVPESLLSPPPRPHDDTAPDGVQDFPPPAPAPAAPAPNPTTSRAGTPHR